MPQIACKMRDFSSKTQQINSTHFSSKMQQMQTEKKHKQAQDKETYPLAIWNGTSHFFKK